MFLRKIDGPRSVTLPDGSIMTRADLPQEDTRRWVASRKAAVIKAVGAGLVTRAEALERYSLSDDEFSEWEIAVSEHGENHLETVWGRGFVLRDPEVGANEERIAVGA